MDLLFPLLLIFIALYFFYPQITHFFNLKISSFISRSEVKQTESINKKSLEGCANVSKEFVSSASSTVDASSTSLAPFDILNSLPLNLLYVFDYTLEETKVKEALAILLEHFPQLGGTIRTSPSSSSSSSTNKVTEAFVDWNSKPQVEVTTCSVTATAEELSLLKENTHGRALSKFINVVTSGYPLPMGPLMRVKITFIENTGQTLLGVSINHCLADAHSLFKLMNIWGSICKHGKSFNFQTPDHDRYKLIYPKNFNPSASCKDPESVGYFRSSIVSRIFAIVSSMKKAGPCKFISLKFTPEDIQKLKDRVKSEGRAHLLLQKEVVSTNDVVCCLMWKLMADLSKFPPDAKFPLQFVVNIRNFPHVDVTDSYFGNATTFGRVELTREEVLQRDLSELVLLMRTTVNNLKTGEHIQSVLESLHYSQFYHPHGLDSFLYIANPIQLQGLFVSNWTRDPVYSLDFGNGDFSKLIFLSPPIPYISIMLPLQGSPKGVEWLMSGPIEMMDQLVLAVEKQLKQN